MYKLFICVIFTIIVVVSSQFCDYVRSINVLYRDSDNSTLKDTKVSGCISAHSFRDDEIRYIGIINQNIPVLSRNFISNLEYLTKIYIGSCRVSKIEPGAFSNLPELEIININDNSIRTIGKGVFSDFPKLKELYIFNNKIVDIEDETFANLPNLRIISLGANYLSYMKRIWFPGTDNIAEFYIYSNSLTKIPSRMFHGWKKLKEIDLNQNIISEIEGQLFRGGSNYINNVWLHHNRLESISPDLLPDSVYIKHISLSGNLLNYLPEAFLNDIPVGTLNIFGNPLSCPCMEKINKILWDRNIIVDNRSYPIVNVCKGNDVPVCGLSRNNLTECMESVDRELTRRFLRYLKQWQYDTVLDADGQQCAMFDGID